MRKRKEREGHDRLATPGATREGGGACFTLKDKHVKTSAAGLAWTLQTDDDEYRFSYVRDG